MGGHDIDRAWVGWSVLLATLCVAGPALAATREQVEADWQRQDATRLAEIRQPGVVRFPGEEINWPGVAEGEPAAKPGRPWRIAWEESPGLGFGRNRIGFALESTGPLGGPVELTVETVVFTQDRAVRQVVLQRRLEAPGPVPVEFQIAAEGAAAVLVSAKQGGAAWQQGRAFFIPPVAETLDRAERLMLCQCSILGWPGSNEASPRNGSTGGSLRSTPATPRAEKLVGEFPPSPPPELAELHTDAGALAEREKASGPDPDARADLYRRARWLARRVAFENPRLNFDKLLVVKRFTQQAYPDVCLNHMPWVSRPGGDICVVTLAGAEGEDRVRNVLDGRLGPGHVHGLDLWWDADRVVFGFAKAASAEPPPGWLDRRTSYELRRTVEPIHLFEIGLDSGGLRQLTDGPWSDLDPTYLPGGDVAFVSERCGYSLQCNELDKDETSCNLYVVRPDGSNVRRLSVTKDGDYLPHTLDDGTIAYTRWEYQERGWAHVQSIWFVRPDGTGADALFKQHLNEPWALEDMRSVPGVKRLVAVATGHHTLPAGPVVLVDPHQGMNSPRGIRIVTPGVVPPEGGMSGTAVDGGGVRGRGGHYMTPWPLSETTFLASYTYGPQNDVTGYGIYLVDCLGTRELVYCDPAISCFYPMPVTPRPRPPAVADVTDGAALATCMVANVARGVEGVDPASIRYLRISQRMPWPYTIDEGGHRYEPDVKRVMINWTPARVLGEVPVEPDGSAHFIVPADTPVYFQLLDENHMELRRMRSFISFQPGETRGCFGCHESREEAPGPVPFPVALLRDPSVPRPPPWGDRPISFLRDVQPVFDRHCTGCHGGLKPAAGLDFSGGLTGRANRCYDTILAHGLVSRSNVGDDAKVTPPLAFGSHRSKLVQVLRDGPCADRAELSEEDWLRLVTWIDANAPYHDGFLNKRQPEPPYDLPSDRGLVEKLAAVHARRCAACHQAAEITRPDWIDLAAPGETLFLTAPLAESAGGSGICPGPVYRDREDADYQAVLALVHQSVQTAWHRPRRDVKSLPPPAKDPSRP